MLLNKPIIKQAHSTKSTIPSDERFYSQVYSNLQCISSKEIYMAYIFASFHCGYYLSPSVHICIFIALRVHLCPSVSRFASEENPANSVVDS